MKLPLRYYDDPLLRKKAEPVEALTPEILDLAQGMINTVIETRAVGVAGPQVGKLLRLFVIRDERMEPDGKYVLDPPEVIINPTLFNPSEERVKFVEGCLSLPGLYLEVIRPQKIHARYMNLKGEWIEEHLDDFRARVMMHENDHLNGVLTIDRLEKGERRKIEPHLLAIKKKYGSTDLSLPK